ncbi:UDP-N-acetylmuramoyl-L-alanine--D-glutamate ligase [Paenibacillus yanchengensis]|uniref:UDP-N-acetylmuramoylalanine--D-glutamate ligase n=1 Tax=Paenibacillus yanchengensis TaxID=2035833 RepID=A0ABW4YKP2_9BACL
MYHPSSYSNKRVVVLGMARSGASIAKLFHQYGAKVTINDMKDRKLCSEADELEQMGIIVICGSHPADLVTSETALLIKNPGIPYSAPPVIAAQQLQIPIITEVEAAYYLSPAPIIGITGSNGKTTTTSLTGLLLKAAGLLPIVAGNIGRPLSEAAHEATVNDWLVAELSSFQLKGTVNFQPHIAVLLNISETHLDYHGSMDDYVTAKSNIFRNQTTTDYAIWNADDPLCNRMIEKSDAKKIPFSLYEQLPYGVYVSPPYKKDAAEPLNTDPSLLEERYIVYREEASDSEIEQEAVQIVKVRDLSIPGKHNVANALAALAIVIATGVKPQQVVAELCQFKGVEHRLEFVREMNGVAYYNDSKATNAVATMMSVSSLPEKVILIAGGLDRGSDYSELLPLMKERVKAVVLLGQTRFKLAEIAKQAGLICIEIVEPDEDVEKVMQQATRKAASLANPGDIVLLSPACASWDMFDSFEQRGSMFKNSTHTL